MQERAAASEEACPYCLVVHLPEEEGKSREEKCEQATERRVAELEQHINYEMAAIAQLMENYQKLAEAYQEEKSNTELEKLKTQIRDLKRSKKRFDKKHEKLKDSGILYDEGDEDGDGDIY